MIATTATDMSISITPCDTHVFLGKSEQASEFTSSTRTVTSEHTIELIKLWHARLGGLGFKRLKALAKLQPDILRIPLQASFNKICHCCQRSSMKRGVAPPSISREVSPLEEVHFDIFTFNGRYTVYLIDRGSRAEFTYSLDKKSDLPKALQQFLTDCNTASFSVGSFVHQLQSKEDKGINAAALDSYFKDNGIHQQVKIIYGDNAGENDRDSLNKFLTRLRIRHLSSIEECQLQNGLAEKGGWVLGCGVRHDMHLSGLGPMFEEFSISLNAQRRNILPHESLGGRSPFSILFPTKTPPLHLKPFGCHTTILKPEAALLKKTQPRGLTGIYIGTAWPRGQSGYLMWTPSEKRITTAVHAVFDEKNFPARRFSPRIHDLFASLPSTHNELFDDHLSVSQYTPSPQHTHVTPVESHSYSSDEDQPPELDTASDDEEPNDDMPAISVEEGKLTYNFNAKQRIFRRVQIQSIAPRLYRQEE